MTEGTDHGEMSYEGSGKLDGKVALITGGGSGIGRAVSIAFAREGADIVISYLHGEEDAENTVALIEKSGGRAVAVGGDITDEHHCNALVQTAISQFGKLDVLVNNAAYQKVYENLEDIGSEDWDQLFKTNIYAPFYLARASVPHMKPGSCIINTTSLQAKSPSAELVAYAATKGALSNFTAGLALMLAGRGIRVNAVAPGPIWTPLIPGSLPSEEVAEFGKDTPLGRPGQPAELAGAYVLLASDLGSYITGAVLPVTGGLTML